MLTATELRKTYYREFWFSMGAYILLTLAVGFFIKYQKPEGIVLYLLAPLPSMPIGYTFYALLKYLNNCDEYLRTAISKAVALATGATLFLTSFWGFLESFANAPHLMANLVYAIFWVSYAVITALGRFVFKGLSLDGANI